MPSLRFITFWTVLCALPQIRLCEHRFSRSYGGIRYYPDYDKYQDVISATEPDSPEHVFTRIRPDKGIDITVLVILTLLKFLLIKAKGLGIILFLAFKVPVLFIIMAGKLLIAIKAAKIVKLITMPLNLLSMLPLIGAPFLLLTPLLLPLLLMLPIPALTPTTTTTPASTSGRRKRHLHTSPQYGVQEILYSEQCLERLACQLGSYEKPSLYATAVIWALNEIEEYIKHPKMSSYTRAYKDAILTDVINRCTQSYICSIPQINNNFTFFNKF